MSKESVLDSLNALTIEQANILSLGTVGESGKKITVLKTSDGSGYDGSLSQLINQYYAESFENREWIGANFYILNVQSVGGQPDCPC